ncbi:SGNH/GDSL hydrolase family protein [Fictibacillus phosphorivorans]|uniref:SGNH/GDSL hydrolase family protein n=1 Tax=Fictibacillus phosphorivorans TaxID=1221500 RepID=UPI003CF968E8
MNKKILISTIFLMVLIVVYGNIHYQNKVDAVSESAKKSYALYEKEMIKQRKDKLQSMLISLGAFETTTILNAKNDIYENLVKQQDQTIVFFGDSTTEQNQYTKGEDGHVRIIDKKLSSVADVNIINSGISGNDSSHLLKRVQTGVLQHKPDVVVLSTGINDSVNLSKNDIYKNLELIITTIQEKTDAKIIFRTSSPTLDKEINQRITEEINPMAMELAKMYDVGYADLYSYFESKTSMGIDGYMNDIYHPNGKGQKVISDYMLNVLLTN